MPEAVSTQNQRTLMQNQNRDKNVSIEDIVNKKNDRLKGIKIMSGPNDVLDKNSFLKILLKQLEKQDPMKPQEDREFIAQMAQFSSLEQMKNVADEVKSMKNMSANNFIGKIVSGKDFVSGKEIEGLVTNVILDKSGQAFLRVGGKTVKLEDVQAVALATEPNQQLSQQQAQKQYGENVSRETNGAAHNLQNNMNSGHQEKTDERGDEVIQSSSTMSQYMKMKLLQPSKFVQQAILK